MGVVYLAVQVPNCFLWACGACVCVCEAFIQDFTAGGGGGGLDGLKVILA